MGDWVYVDIPRGAINDSRYVSVGIDIIAAVGRLYPSSR